MKNTPDEKILNLASSWIEAKHKVIIATVVRAWGSSPRPVGSRMIVNQDGNFSGSVSGGCIETAVIRESIELFKNKKSFKKLDFNIQNETAWEIGLPCGGEISIFLEKIK